MTDVPAEDGGDVPEADKIRLGEEEDRIVLKGSFEKGQLVMLILEGDNTTHRYFVPTTKRPFLAMCVGTFQDSDARAVEFPISKEGLEGTFKVKLLIDDKQYDTGVVINA